MHRQAATPLVNSPLPPNGKSSTNGQDGIVADSATGCHRQVEALMVGILHHGNQETHEWQWKQMLTWEEGHTAEACCCQLWQTACMRLLGC